MRCSGEAFHVPGGARHAFRNPAGDPAVSVVVTTMRLADLFREVGVPTELGAPPAPVTDAAMQRFLEVSERYGYWNATPEENAAIGVALPMPG